jgi:hypothetical protein
MGLSLGNYDSNGLVSWFWISLSIFTFKISCVASRVKGGIEQYLVQTEQHLKDSKLYLQLKKFLLPGDRSNI